MTDILTNQLKCDSDDGKIYWHLKFNGDGIFLHFVNEYKDHINGYYLLVIDKYGLLKVKDIGEVDEDDDFIPLLDSDNKHALKIIGVDEL